MIHLSCQIMAEDFENLIRISVISIIKLYLPSGYYNFILCLFVYVWRQQVAI